MEPLEAARVPRDPPQVRENAKIFQPLIVIFSLSSSVDVSKIVFLRYDDNFDVINCINVMANPTDKGKISDYGTPEKFLESVGYLLGRQSYEGENVLP